MHEESEKIKALRLVEESFDREAMRASYNPEFVNRYTATAFPEEDFYESPVEQYERALMSLLLSEKDERQFRRLMRDLLPKVDPHDLLAYRPYHKATMNRIQQEIDERIERRLSQPAPFQVVCRFDVDSQCQVCGATTKQCEWQKMVAGDTTDLSLKQQLDLFRDQLDRYEIDYLRRKHSQ